MPSDVALYATCWTLAGGTIPGLSDEVSPRTFAARVEAAREAGINGLGLARLRITASSRRRSACRK